MTNKFIPSSPHEIDRLESKFKLFFFLRDLGIKSAYTPAIRQWIDYTDVLAYLTIGG